MKEKTVRTREKKINIVMFINQICQKRKKEKKKERRPTG